MKAMFVSAFVVIFFAFLSACFAAPLDNCNIPPPANPLSNCTASNWGQQVCYSNRTFVTCDYDHWTVPMICPANLVCKPHPANPSFNIICDYPNSS